MRQITMIYKPISTSVLLLAISTSLIAQTFVEQWHPMDIHFESSESYANSFQEVDLSVRFIGPDGTTLTIPGFYNGSSTWTVRFSPTKTGNWTYTTSSNDAELNQKKGSITCVTNTNKNVHGRLMIDESNKHHFKYEDGTRFFLLGSEIDWLALIDMQDPNLTKTKEIIDMYAAQGFNSVLMNAYAYDTRWCQGQTEDEDWGPPLLHPWQGDHSNHDFSRLNTDYWKHFDKVIDYMFQKGIVAYIYFKVYNKLVNWPPKGSKEDELYFSNIVARYQAYPNIIWCFAKETYYEPDHAYIHKMLDVITENDAYDRLRTTHDDNARVEDYAFDGENADNIDFYTDQTQNDIYNNSIEDYKRKEWPVSNMEPGYQGGNDGNSSYQGDNISAEELVKRMYMVYMAGAYATYYYTWHAWDVVRTAEEPKNLVYYKYLSDFFTRTNWYELVPNEDVITGIDNYCLAKVGSEYIIYLGKGRNSTLTIEGATKQLQGIWMNVFTGEEKKVSRISNGSYQCTSPWGDAPSLLWLHKK
jgi:hypothetical protein